MKIILLTFLLFLTRTEVLEWVAASKAYHKAWSYFIEQNLTTNKTLDNNGRHIVYYTHTKKEFNGNLMTIVYDTVGFFSYKVEVLYENNKLRCFGISEIDTLTNINNSNQKYKWTVTDYYFKDDKIGVYEKYGITINQFLPTHSDTSLLFLCDRSIINFTPLTCKKILTQIEDCRKRVMK